VAVATMGTKRTESIVQADLIPFHQKSYPIDLIA
jgi:hypothetical protein